MGVETPKQNPVWVLQVEWLSIWHGALVPWMEDLSDVLSSGSGNGWCLDPRVIDHMTWSVKGVVRARILAPSLAKAEAGLAQGAILEHQWSWRERSLEMGSNLGQSDHTVLVCHVSSTLE